MKIIKEAYTARIPVIKFNDTLQERYWKHCYGVPGNLNSSSTKVIDNIFFTIELDVEKPNKKNLTA
jgi:hypothetical protein